MQNIDFKTSSNIILSYPLASPGERILAYSIDCIINIFIYSCIVYVARSFEAVMMLVGVVLFLLYHLSFELLNLGQSPGKMLISLRVVSLDGNTPSLKQLVIRWAYRLLDILLTAGTLGIFSLISSPYGQRIGDLLAGTAVVKSKQVMMNSIKELEHLNEINRNITYPSVVKYTDEDMILVKTMIKRYKSHPKIENAELVTELTKKICVDLNIPEIRGNRVAFLENLLSDYIVLTR